MAHQENTEIRKTTNTEKELLKDLFANNRGVAIGESHDCRAAGDFIMRNLKQMKKAGLDTIYIEFDPEVVEYFQSSDIADLKTLRDNINKAYRDKGHPEHEAFNTILREEAAFYNGDMTVDQAFQFNISRVDIAISARENGIRLAKMDVAPEEVKKQCTMENGDRIGKANHSWTKAVEDDRKQVDPKGEGKFLVWGGYNHFVDSEWGKGLVDDKLGIPTIGFTRSSMPKALGFMEKDFQKAAGANQPDFWISGGRKATDVKGSYGDGLPFGKSEVPDKPVSEKNKSAAVNYQYVDDVARKLKNGELPSAQHSHTDGQQVAPQAELAHNKMQAKGQGLA
jgi:hypothetical protein